MNEAFAPAKINLTLHVTGQRHDGYHLLDSLVVFADIGDRLTFETDADLTLTVTGPNALGVPVDDSNLVLRAARMVDANLGAKITLVKTLPTAAGIGGGSSNAAATLKALGQMWAKPLPGNPEWLGADVPVCLRGRATRMQGIGEQLSDAPDLPPAWLVLVNPRVSVPTPAVFKTLVQKTNAPMPKTLPAFASATAFSDWLGSMRNDLQDAAISLEPVIGTALSALRATNGCLLARMSGSGATCWGMFGDAQSAAQAAARVQQANPSWWVVSSEIKAFS